MLTVGERIKAFRTLSGLTQDELAKKCGIATITIHQYENNKRQPRIENLKKIANALNVPIDGFLDNDFHYFQLLASGAISGMKEGLSISLIPESESRRIEEELEQKNKETQINLNKLSFFIRSKYTDFTDSNYSVFRDLINTFSVLNAEGQRKAIERIEELSEIPKYQKQYSLEEDQREEITLADCRDSQKSEDEEGNNA